MLADDILAWDEEERLERDRRHRLHSQSAPSAYRQPRTTSPALTPTPRSATSPPDRQMTPRPVETVALTHKYKHSRSASPSKRATKRATKHGPVEEQAESPARPRLLVHQQPASVWDRLAVEAAIDSARRRAEWELEIRQRDAIRPAYSGTGLMWGGSLAMRPWMTRPNSSASRMQAEVSPLELLEAAQANMSTAREGLATAAELSSLSATIDQAQAAVKQWYKHTVSCKSHAHSRSGVSRGEVDVSDPPDQPTEPIDARLTARSTFGPNLVETVSLQTWREQTQANTAPKITRYRGYALVRT